MTGNVDGVTFTGDGEYVVMYDFQKDVATGLDTDGDMQLSTPEGHTATSAGDILFALTPVEPCE